MLEQQLWGNTLEAWGISILFIVGAVVIVKLFSFLGRKVLNPFISRTRNKLDDVIFYSLEAPVKFAVILLGIWIAIHKLVYPDSFMKIVDSTYKILIVLNFTWILARLSGGLLQVYWGHRADGNISKMMPVIKRSVLVVIWIIGFVMALSNVGVNISALLGTLGIGGIAFALAAQDTVKNIFGAFTIFTDKPFSIGDTIRVDSFEGTVIDVGIRSTKILGYDRRITTLPNYKITDASIINITSEPMRRVLVKLGLTYDTTPEKMKEALTILRTIPERVENVSSAPSDIIANFTDYTDSALVITYIYFIKKQGDILKVTSDMNVEILAAFNKAELAFAFPTKTLYIHNDATLEVTEETGNGMENKTMATDSPDK
ncbi:MAG: mechanosensitive ion channel family protein [Bacteroidales bacterium]|nr:mechanosensitive ion channel family protein [Bacteroidales bacterium]